jgi:prepilin-type N-terminal cleavage/methylation domain-containing protein
MQKQKAFTIVELLIVIVVIGILAAITIVAYNGIQNRAHAATAQSDANGAKKKFLLAQVDTGLFPTTTADLPSESGTTYELTVNNTVIPSTFCLTATNTDVSYRITESSAAVAGSCPGHSSNGVAAVTNLVTNPSAEIGLQDYGFNQASYGSRAQASTAAYVGNFGQRFTTSTAGTVGGLGPYIQVPNLSSVESYVASAWVRASRSMQYYVSAERRDSTGANIGTLASSSVTLSPNVWTRISLVVPPTPNMVRFTFTVYSQSTTMAIGDTIDYDGLMVTEGTSLLGYADGNSPDWIWNGTINNSTSTGPGL